MWVNDAAGCVFVNRAYLEFLGLHRQTEVSGYDWAQYIHPDDREFYVGAYRASVQACSAFSGLSLSTP